MAISAKLDMKPLSEAMSALGRATSKRVLYRTLKEGGDGMRSEATRAVREDLNVKAGAVRKAMKIKPSKARGASIGVDLNVELGPLPLGAFGARQTKKGVTFKVKKNGPRKRLSRTFIATMKSGHTGVFRRESDPSKVKPRVGPGYHGLPIYEMFTASVGSSLRARDIRRRVLQAGRERFQRELQNQIKQELRKL